MTDPIAPPPVPLAELEALLTDEGPRQTTRRPRWLPVALVLALLIAGAGFAFAATRSDPTEPASRRITPPVTNPLPVTFPPTLPPPTTVATTIPPTTVPPATAPPATAPPPTAPPRTRPPATTPPAPPVIIQPPRTTNSFGPSCGHPPGAIIDIFINGQPAGTQTAGPDGCIPVRR